MSGAEDGDAFAADGAHPVPAVARPRRRSVRHNEWTREKMVLFLRELAATQSVACAAKAVGMSRSSAYNLRNRLQHTPFSLGWEVALEMGMHQLAHAVMDRAVNGVEVQHYYHGELVATTRRFDNRLATWVLENPWKVGRNQVSRELSSRRFDALLERIELESLDWTRAETDPKGRALSEIDKADRKFWAESWYVAEALAEDKARGKR